MRAPTNSSKLRDLALRSLLEIFGDPSITTEDGASWTFERRTDGGGFRVYLNGPESPEVAEVTVHAGPHRVYTVHTECEDELQLGLRVVEKHVRP